MSQYLIIHDLNVLFIIGKLFSEEARIEMQALSFPYFIMPSNVRDFTEGDRSRGPTSVFEHSEFRADAKRCNCFIFCFSSCNFLKNSLMTKFFIYPKKISKAR